MFKLKKIALLGVFALIGHLGYSQCADNNTLFGDISPNIPASVNVPGDYAGVTNAWAGDKYTVVVCAGQTYTFTMCDNTINYDAHLTLQTTAGAALAFNDDFCGFLPQIQWTATFTGTVEILVDDFGCTHTLTSDMWLVVYVDSECGTGVGSGSCGTDVGTFTTLLDGVPITPGVDVAYLCGATGCMTSTSNNDFVLPSPASNNPLEVSELMYAIYTSAPPASPDPAVDAGYSGSLWTGQDISECGNSTTPVLIGANPLWYVPITCDDSDNAGDPNAAIHYDQDGDGCYDVGTPLQVLYLTAITASATEDCDNGTVAINVQGGLPLFDGVSTYTITNTGDGTVISGAIGDNGYILLNGLTTASGAYSITITDGASCSVVVSGAYVECPCLAVSYTGLPASMACSDAAILLTADPLVTPCFQVLVMPSNSQAANTMQGYEDGVAVWLLASVTANTFVTQSFQQASPSASAPGTTVDLCEGTVGANMTYYVLDCHTGNLITSGTWISDGACQTITITPPSTNIEGISTWSSTGGGLTTTDWGVAVFDPGAAGAGTYTVTYSWNDNAGCSGTDAQVITVTDPTPPVLTCPGNMTANTAAGLCTADVATPNPTVTDNCVVQDLTWALTGATVGTSAATGINNLGTATFNTGVTTVTYTAFDGSNTVTCSFTVTITDNIDPTITCPTDVTQVNDAGVCQAAVVIGIPATADNCGVLSVVNDFTGTNNASGTYPVGTTTVNWTVTDINTNTNTNCSMTVTITDSENPVAVCQNVTVTLDAAGNGSTTAVLVDNGSTDNCAVTGLSLSQTAFTCADLGANAVTLTATDAAGNTGTCAATVTVVDNIDPTAVCQNVTIFLDAAGNASTTAAAVDNGSADNCTSITLSLDQTAFTCADLGANAVVLTVTDGSSNTATCGATVTVVDNINPTITCPGDQNEIFDASCQFILPDYTGLVTAGDNCSQVVTQSPVATTVITGTTTITMTSTDPSGNIATCTFDVIPTDGIAPIAACQDVTIFLDAAGNASTTAAAIDNGSTDNCGITSMTLDQTAFVCADLGTNPVVLTVSDGTNTDNCAATVTVVDNLDPTAICQNITIFLDAAGNATTTAAAVNNGSSDNCGTVTLSLDFTAFTCADVGVNAVVLTVTDGSGNSSTCNANVTVVDNTVPTITCPVDQNVSLNASCQFSIIDYTGMGIAADNCSAVVSQSPIIGTLISASTVVTLTATDPSGNTATCTFNVIPTDDTNPVAVCQDIIINVDAAGNATATAAAVNNGSTDNCAVTGLALDITAFTCADVGVNAVVLTVSDAAGNTDVCNANVTVVDNIDPVAVCQPFTVNLDAAGNATITTGNIDNGSSDNCSIASMSLDITAFTCADVGPNNVTLTVTDGSGNTDFCVAVVTVVDNINPTAVCQPFSVALDATGNATITTGDIDNGSSDNCAIASLSLDITAFTCADIGANTVTLTVTDASGNTSTCTSTVTVTDPNVPTSAAGADATICDYDTYTLAGVAGGSATAGTWSSSLDGTFSLNTDPNAVYTPGPLAIAAGSVVLTWLTDPSPCATATSSMTLTIDPAPVFTVALNANPSACAVSDGSILISGLTPVTAYTLSYDSAGITIVVGAITTDGAGGYLVTGLGAGSYNNWSITINGCTTTDATSIGLSDPSAPVFTVAITAQPTSCAGTQGEITISGLLGSTLYNISYDDDGTFVPLTGVTSDAAGNYVITGLDAGSYTTFVISISGCTGSDATILVLTDPPAPTFTVAMTTNPTSCGGNEGSITISGLNPSTTYDITFDDDGILVTLIGVTTDGAGNFLITGLDAGAYDNWTVTDGINCTGTDITIITLTDPGAPIFVPNFTSDPSICGASDGSITITGLLGSTVYDITYDDDGTLVTLLGVTTNAAGEYVITGLDAGAYDNWTVSIAGCSGSDATVITLTDPPPPTFTVALNLDPSSCGGADGEILVSGLTPLTTYDIGYDDDGTPVVLSGVTSDAAGNFLITGLNAGIYDNWTLTLLGCVGTNITIVTLTDPGAPTFTVAFTSDPLSCGAADGSITISGLLGTTSYDVTYDDDGTLVTLLGVTTDAAGNLLIPGLDAGAYDNWTVTLAGCTGTDGTLITLSDPGSPTFSIIFQSDPTTCGGVDGSITLGGLLGATTYDITYDDDGTLVTLLGVTTDAFGNFAITGLNAGAYNNWTVSLAGCTGADASTITLTDPPPPTFTVSAPSDPSGCGLADGSVTVFGLIPSTTYDITYDSAGVFITITVTTDASGNYLIPGLGAGIYSNFTVTLLGCTGTDVASTVITLFDPGAPTFSVASSDPTTCLGIDGTLTFSGLTPSTSYDITYDDGTGLVTVTVTSDALGDIVITGLAAGSFNGFTASEAGCIGTDASTLVLADPPTPTAPVAGSNASICDTDPIVDLTAVAGFGGSLEWYSDATLLANIGSGTNLTPGSSLGSTVYYVNETSNGCVGPATAITVTITTCVVIVVEIPTGFSPDNDGVNDTWELVNLNLAYPNNIVRVFNRWGTILFESNGYATPWDGKVNGDDLPTASYFFTIDFGDGIRDPETGSVTIIR